MMAGLITNATSVPADRRTERRRPHDSPDQHRQRRAGRNAKKSLRVLDRSYQHLLTATFDVNINSVLGGGIKNPKMPGRSTARASGFSTSIESSTTAKAS
jgi:hypothetical protein